MNLRDLYQEVIIDHTKSPRNFHDMAQANYHAEGFNPLCGDHLYLYLRIQDDIITDISFTGEGCAISTASASLMTEQLKGKTIAEAKNVFEHFHTLVMQAPDVTIDTQHLGKLAVLAGVREFPTRVKCATLAWHTLDAALKNQITPISTED